MSTEELYENRIAAGKQKLLGSPARLNVRISNSNSNSMDNQSLSTPTGSTKKKTVIIGKGNYMKKTESSKLASNNPRFVSLRLTLHCIPHAVC